MSEDSKRPPWWAWPLMIALLPVVIAVLLLWLVGSLLALTVVWLTWCPRGRYALVVYSNSPIWQEYFETHVLPAVAGRAAVLNWSERRQWAMSFPVLLFRLFGGSRQFNPIAIVFEPLLWPRQFRFYRAFRSFKHGRPEEVERLRAEFLKVLNELAPSKAA
jgi:hypothetical protein